MSSSNDSFPPVTPVPVQPQPVARPGRPVRMASFPLAVLGALVLAACGGGDDDDDTRMQHAVYAMTDASAGNQIVAYRRGDDGLLSPLGIYDTGGAGNGRKEVSAATPNDGVDVLASQGAVQMTPDKRVLVAVNTGSNSITSFRIGDDGGLVRVSVAASGGLQPNALAVRDDLVYVTNVGDAANGYVSNVTGFRLAVDGTLTPVGGSTRSLSTATAQPARATFNVAGTALAVSELTTNRISVMTVSADGTLGPAVVSNSAGAGPFGSVFLKNGALLATEVMANAVSSYRLAASGALTPISTSVGNGQAATCWIIATPAETYAYTSNSGTGTMSSYRVGTDGALTLLQAVASTLEGATSGVVDAGISEDGRYLYALNSGAGSITVLRIESDGSLTKLQTVSQGLPALGPQGLVAR